MPVYRRETLPRKLPWGEVDDFETLVLDPSVEGGARALAPASPQERVIVLAGEVVAESALGRVTLRRNDWVQVPAAGATL